MEIDILTDNSLDEYEEFISQQSNVLLYHSKKIYDEYGVVDKIRKN